MKAGSEPLYFSCTQKSHCLFGYISEPKIQLLPAKNATFTYEKSNFNLLFLPLLAAFLLRKEIFEKYIFQNFSPNFLFSLIQYTCFSIKYGIRKRKKKLPPPGFEPAITPTLIIFLFHALAHSATLPSLFCFCFCLSGRLH